MNNYMERSEVGRSCQLHIAERMEGNSFHNDNRHKLITSHTANRHTTVRVNTNSHN
jgi:hypothetical protein